MRKTSFTLALLAISSATLVCNAQDDFSALLADLSFSDLPELNEPLAVAETEQNLKPVPELVMPSTTATAKARVALQDPIPATEPEAINQQIDLEAAFALQGIQPNNTAPSKPVGHILHHANVSNDCGCDAGVTCTPHVKPSLPSSTFYQYFRTSKCNVNVWDGYQQRCGKALKHVHGTCDCFTDKGCGLGGCKSSDCASCDGGCDR